MIKFIYVLFILLLSLLSAYSSTFNNTICIDCTDENKERCHITKTGFECFNQTNQAKYWDYYEDHFGLNRNPPSNKDLNVCIPKRLEIHCIENNNFKYVIVWSPELGCQLVQRDYDEKEICFTARQTCPCEYEESGGTNDIYFSFSQ
ncbi:uncharacterized protein LOC108086686 isoform X2 [Drosophila ficusphila]|uniref:uncharacterized protein LOC108086686 isoform X2 n=1 Tax=Drosophila ficusphila TaxID=30025 RepID=UPI0007E5DD9F|nr:uncharacterized protein LOC108086686 isoform X2 [Drosophila ficusphila]